MKIDVQVIKALRDQKAWSQERPQAVVARAIGNLAQCNVAIDLASPHIAPKIGQHVFDAWHNVLSI
jgi:hypothetical protein